MPAYDSIGRHHNQCLLPGRPETIKKDPEQFVQHGKSRAAALSLEHCQLLTLKRDFPPAKSGESETAERGRQPKAAKDRTWLEFITECRLRKSRKLLISELYSILSNDTANPMNWVRQKTTSSYTAVIMNPLQAFEILLNIPEPRRTLVLTDAATALRVSEILGLEYRRFLV